MIVIGGALSDHTGGTELAQALAPDFTVLTIDRRARGESGDASPGIAAAVERELADLAALVDAVGGWATLVGSSSGAVLSLAAAAHGLPVDRLVLFEPPFATEEFPPVAPPAGAGGTAPPRPHVRAPLRDPDQRVRPRRSLRVRPHLRRWRRLAEERPGGGPVHHHPPRPGSRVARPAGVPRPRRSQVPAPVRFVRTRIGADQFLQMRVVPAPPPAA